MILMKTTNWLCLGCTCTVKDEVCGNCDACKANRLALVKSELSALPPRPPITVVHPDILATDEDK